MIQKKIEGRRNPKAWPGSRLTVSGLPSTPNPRPKRRVETPGDPWGVPQPPEPSSPAYGTPPTANRWFLPLSSSQWGQTLPTTSVMFPVRIEPLGHAQGGKKIPGGTWLYQFLITAYLFTFLCFFMITVGMCWLTINLHSWTRVNRQISSHLLKVPQSSQRKRFLWMQLCNVK